MPPEIVLFNRLEQSLPRVTLAGTDYWIAEGDLLCTRVELLAYAKRRVDAAARQTVELQVERLIMDAAAGRPKRWRPGFSLSYAIRRDSFRPAARYAQVVQELRAAALAWEATCGVQFRHREELDQAPDPTAAGALFVVEQVDQARRFIALAFFPHDPPDKRRLRLETSLFFSSDLAYDRVGVLRHELGHVLGFRHERLHSGATTGTREDGGELVELTDYDARSVMHHVGPGGEAHTWALSITETDRIGAQRVYGRPLAEFELYPPG